MESHTRDTAHFSQMEEAMRRLGSWEPFAAGRESLNRKLSFEP